MNEIGHHPKCGPLVEVTAIKWGQPIPIDEAHELVRSFEDDEVLLPSARLHELEQEVNALENELADEKARWRKRCQCVVEIARKMLAAPTATVTTVEDLFKW